jgi:hypothetical protein
MVRHPRLSAGAATVPKVPGQNTRCDGQVVTPPTGVDNGNMPMGLSSTRAKGDNRLSKAGPLPEEPYAERQEQGQ